MLTTHTLFGRLGADLCGVSLKDHILTGDDYCSKLGSKHSAVKMEPLEFLEKYAEQNDLSGN